MERSIGWGRLPRWCRAAATGGLLATLVVADHRGCLLVPRGGDLAVYDGARVEVARVIDGDTLDVAVADARRRHPHTRIRVWGIDCPDPGRAGTAPERGARSATARTRALVGGAPVTLRLETHRTRGVFGRVLAHVELTDGTNLGAVLLAEGLAVTDERTPHARLEAFARAERHARRRRAGLWADPHGPGSARDQ